MSLWQIWWIALAVKTILLPIIPITPDEAYYFSWARHPALSYYDHPPVISWLMATALPLWKTTLGIRWPGVFLSHLGFIPWFKILKRLHLSKRAQTYWLLSILLGPLTGLGGFVITPDVPLVFFWSIGLWALLWTMEKPTIGRWLVVGLACGFGLLSKYMMILFFPAALVWFFWDNRLAVLKKPGPWIALLTAFIVFLPVVIWNYDNHFASFLFQTRHGLQTKHEFLWNWPLEYVGTQLALLNPVFAVVGILVMRHLVKAPPARKRETEFKFLLAFTVLPFLFFLMSSFRARVEANWPVCGYPTFMALAAMAVDGGLGREYSERAARWLRGGMWLSGVFVLLVISHTAHPWLPIPKEKDHTYITREWIPDVEAVKDLRPLFARSYQMAAFLSYYRPPEDEVFKIAGFNRVDSYDFLPQSVPKTKGYVILKADDVLPDALKNAYVFKNPKILPSHHLVYELEPVR